MEAIGENENPKEDVYLKKGRCVSNSETCNSREDAVVVDQHHQCLLGRLIIIDVEEWKRLESRVGQAPSKLGEFGFKLVNLDSTAIVRLLAFIRLKG
jgi:hypothetical protein